jgi:hypothetical protein
VRGIPNEGNFFAFQEDGMLIYGENEGFFFKGDVMIRPDMMTEGVEVVRGGPAPIFADNAAAIFNLITRQGGERVRTFYCAAAMRRWPGARHPHAPEVRSGSCAPSA